jgi:hypothetical protein
VVEPENGVDEAALAVAARHALHDEELVAAFATGSLDDDGEIARARQFVERCVACRDLHHDLEAIGGAIRASGQFTAAAPRDYRLSVEDAVRLGGTVRAGGFLARLRDAVMGVAGPLGASMAALGIAGILVGSATIGGLGAMPLSVDTGATGQTPVAEVNSGASRTSAPDGTHRIAVVEPGSTFEEGDGGAPRESGDDAGANPSTWLLGGSIALLAGGVILLGVTFRRGRHDRGGT